MSGLPVPPSALDPDELAGTLRAVRDRAPPEDPTSLGCSVAIVAIVALVFMPVLTRFASLSAGALFAIGATLFVVALAGGFFGIFGGGFVRGAIAADVDEAVRELAEGFPGDDPERLRRAAVRILDQSIVSTGPASAETFDRREVAERLGPALDYVTAVERVLLAQGAIYPCFTAEDPDRVGR